jgi:hypothetical protein
LVIRWTFKDIFNSCTDLVIVDFDHPIKQLLANLEWLFTYDPNCSPITKWTNFRERDTLALFQATCYCIPIECLSANDAHMWTANVLDILRYAHDKATATDSAKDGIEVLGRQLLKDLHPDDALAYNHQWVVVQRHKDETVCSSKAHAASYV